MFAAQGPAPVFFPRGCQRDIAGINPHPPDLGSRGRREGLSHAACLQDRKRGGGDKLAAHLAAGGRRPLHPPHTWRGGKGPRSTSATCPPAWASSRAATDPAGPAPTISAS